MTPNRTFRFVDASLQESLVALVQASGVPHALDAGGSLLYALADVDVVENELICSIRDRVFPQWSIFTLEGDDVHRPRTTARYRAYMQQQGIPFVEEVADTFVWFLVSQEQDSFAWPVAHGEEPEHDGADRVSDVPSTGIRETPYRDSST